MSDHPAVVAHRAMYRALNADNRSPADEQRILNQFDAVRQNVDRQALVIEPTLATADTVPPELAAKAYSDGVDIWGSMAPYNTGEGATRTINDGTLVPELIELRQHFVDRSLNAGDEDEARA